MCGLSGIINLGGINLNELKQMTDIIRHRGPDDEGFALIGYNDNDFLRGSDTVQELSYLPLINKYNNKESNNFFIGLGHRRLSILDLTARGHQPMTYANDELVIVYNGEIYNYLEIKEELIREGFKFSTSSDTEVILAAYKMWGENCVKHFNGMWAFAIWDAINKTVFCSRDRLGVKPFYYCENDTSFYFASEIKQFTCVKNITRTANLREIAAYVVFGSFNCSNETWINEIRQLKAAHNMRIKIDTEQRKIAEIIEYPYWSLDNSESYINMNEDECIKAVYDEFERACRIRMRSDVPIGVALSGGLDSSSIVTEICQQLKNDGKPTSALQTFTTCYPEQTDIDETYYADLIDKATGATMNLVYPEISDFYSSYKKTVWTYEGPATPTGFDSVGRDIAAHGIKVCLNGQGGDETMFGYERYYAFYFLDLIKKLNFKKALKEFKLASKHSRLSLKELLIYLFYFNFPLIRIIRKKMKASSYCKKNLLSKAPYNLIKKIYYPKTLKSLIITELTHTQLPHILHMDDKGYMAHSIETRIPFLDYRYIELALKIKPDYKIKNGYTKYIIRKMMDGKMPESVTWRTNKMGFPFPIQKYLNSLKEEDMADLFENPKSATLFNIEKIKKEFSKNKFNISVIMFMNVEIFLRIFDVKISELPTAQG